MKRPLSTEHPPYYQKYIDLVKNDNVLKALDEQIIKIQETISRIPVEKEDYAYADGKWTVKEVLGHIIDTERIMAYRALRFARKDKTPLSGFDQNTYIANANFNKQTLYNLAHEFAVVREANLSLFKNFDESNLDETGVANGTETSVRAVLFMIVGHATHHINVIKEKYLND